MRLKSVLIAAAALMICFLVGMAGFFYAGWLAEWNPTRIHHINQTKKEALQALDNEDYEVAIAKLKKLKDEIGVNQTALFLNLAHAYFNEEDTLAIKHYEQIAYAAEAEYSSVANQQLGVSYFKKAKLKKANSHTNLRKALEHCREALRQNPESHEARFNYELINRLIRDMEENESQKQENQEDSDDPSDDKEQKDGKSEDEKQQQNDSDKEGESTDEDNKDADAAKQKGDDGKSKDSDNNELVDPDAEKKEKENESQSGGSAMPDNMTTEQAKMLLEALKNNEVQYLQQMKRKSKTNKDKSDRPQW
ncbi:MAG: hypothetical protein JJT94_16890 [Bernardetiaceae bacterium]|nr:hypothetical protein [Bernardetiaceae bacterium]